MKLSEEQKQVLRGILDLTKQKQVVSMGGVAGTGKSTIVLHLYNALPNCAVCAFTGKAADVLRKKGVPATTIHKLIYKPMMDENGKAIKDHFGNPIFFKADKLDVDQIIVDEASMVSRDIYEDLVSFGKPLIFIGDHGQLEPVGASINLMQNPDFRLETIHRNAGEIAHFCNWIRQGYKAAAFARYATTGKVKFVNRWQAEAYYPQMDQVICAFNRTRVEVNNKIRASLGLDPSKPVVEDRAMCLKNNNQIGLFNGMQGVIKSIHRNRMVFQTEDLTFDVVFDKSQFGRESYDFEGGSKEPDPFDWCYAVTCHKCVDEDTLIPTEHGLIQIKSLWQAGNNSTLQELNVSIMSLDGVQKAIQIYRGLQEEAIQIRTRLGNQLTGSHRHPVLTWDAKNCDFLWKKLPDVQIGDYVCVSRESLFSTSYVSTVGNFEGRKTTRIPDFLNEEIGYFLGILVGDGHYAKNKSNMLSITNMDDEVLQAFRQILKRQFNLDAGINNSKINNRAKTLYFCSVAVRKYLVSIGLDYVVRDQKTVPADILRSPVSVQASFIRGLFDTDGSVGHSIRLVSVSRLLVEKVQLILMNMGIVSNITSQFYTKYHKSYFTLSISGSNVVLFSSKIGFLIANKKEKLASLVAKIVKVKGKTNLDVIPNLGQLIDEARQEILTHYGRRSRLPFGRFNCGTKHISYIHLEQAVQLLRQHIPDSTVLRKLEQVLDRHYYFAQVTDKKQTVAQMYDLSVPMNESFISNGIVSHNSQGSEWPRVLVIEQKSRGWDHRRWAYTAASRAQSELIWEVY
jgi:intein/homing endonuclease